MQSRKKEAIRFKFWIASEILPQIRKTGRYVPERRRHIEESLPPAHEKMTAADMDRLARLVGIISRDFKYNKSWVAAIWFALRKVTGTPSPEPFDVRHTKIIADECRRIWSCANAFKHVAAETERDFLKKAIRNGENCNVLELFDSEHREAYECFNHRVSTALQPFQKMEIDKFLNQ